MVGCKSWESYQITKKNNLFDFREISNNVSKYYLVNSFFYFIYGNRNLTFVILLNRFNHIITKIIFGINILDRLLMVFL